MKMESSQLTKNQDRILKEIQDLKENRTEEADDIEDEVLVATTNVQEFQKEELELKKSSKKRKIKVHFLAHKIRVFFSIQILTHQIVLGKISLSFIF